MNERRFWPFLYNRKEAIKTNDFVFCNFHSWMHCWQISKTLFFFERILNYFKCKYFISLESTSSWFDWFITLRVVLDNFFFFENLFVSCGLENCRMKLEKNIFYCTVEMQLCCFYVVGRFWAGMVSLKSSINKNNGWFWIF